MHSEKEPLLSRTAKPNGPQIELPMAALWNVEGGSHIRKAVHRTRYILVVLALLMMVVSVAVAFMVIFVLFARSDGKNWLDHKVSPSLMTKAKHSTIVTDAAPCATIGSYMLLTLRGNIIDAGIATLLCTGVYNLHSMGISGGSFLVYYEKSTKKVYTLNFRETAPFNASEDMFVGKADKASQYGGLSIAVPGEIAGYYEAWKRWGKLPWEELFKPTIDLLRNGYYIYPSFSENIVKKMEDLKTFSNPTLLEFLYNDEEKRWYREGDFIKFPKLAETLEILSQEPLAMYNGSLVKTIVKEITDAGGIVTAEDLQQYQPEWNEPISIPLLGTDYVLHGMKPPSSAAVVAFILNIMSGYGYNSKNISSLQDVATYFHRFVEASKFGFAKRSALGDLNFPTAEITKAYQFLMDPKNAESARKNISDHRTFGIDYYGPAFDLPADKGTSHFSGIDSEGNALALTSTINGEFGSMIMGAETGILYNNEMDDFSSPNKSNEYDLPPSPSNFIKPGKKPMSSMSPIIVTDGKTGEVKLILGGSGGSRIVSATSQVAGHHLFLKMSIKEASDMWRFHHQLYPNEIRAAADMPEEIHKELSSRGHAFGKTMPLTAVQALSASEDGFIYGNADYRKNGISVGL